MSGQRYVPASLKRQHVTAVAVRAGWFRPPLHYTNDVKLMKKNLWSAVLWPVLESKWRSLPASSLHASDIILKSFWQKCKVHVILMSWANTHKITCKQGPLEIVSTSELCQMLHCFFFFLMTLRASVDSLLCVWASQQFS